MSVHIQICLMAVYNWGLHDERLQEHMWRLQDFKPRVATAAQQAQQRLAKASSVTSLAVKPKGKAANGTKGKQAVVAKGTKGKKGSKVVEDDAPKKKRDRTHWDGANVARGRSVERIPSNRRFADAARIHQVCCSACCRIQPTCVTSVTTAYCFY